MSEFRVKDGTGKAFTAKVDDKNRLHVKAINLSLDAQRSRDGAGYNLNTGSIALTDGAESSVMYLKYTGTTRFHINRIVFGFGELGGTVSDSISMFVKQNPMTGTIIDDQTAVDMNGNRDFSSANVLSADVYKGAQGKTMTDGTDVLLFFATGGTRVITPVDIILSPGNSIGLTVQLNATSGGNLYAAIVGYETEE